MIDAAKPDSTTFTITIPRSTPLIDDAEEIPRADTARATSMILVVLSEPEFVNVFDMTSIQVNSMPAMMGMSATGMLAVHVRDTLSPDAKQQFLSVWFNACDSMTSGGRAVESGRGPNYYTTVKELRLAIRRALWQLRHPKLDEYSTPQYEDFAEPHASPPTPIAEKSDDAEECSPAKGEMHDADKQS